MRDEVLTAFFLEVRAWRAPGYRPSLPPAPLPPRPHRGGDDRHRNGRAGVAPAVARHGESYAPGGAGPVGPPRRAMGVRAARVACGGRRDARALGLELAGVAEPVADGDHGRGRHGGAGTERG